MAKNFETQQKKINRSVPKDFDKDENFYFNNAMTELSKFHFRLERNEEKLPDDIQNVSDNLDLYFVSAKLNMLHFLYYYKKSNPKSESDLFFSDAILQYIEENSKKLKKENPIIYSKFLVLMTIWKPEEEQYFFELKSFVFSKMQNMTLGNAEYLISALMNYTLEKCNEGNKISRISRKLKRKRFQKIGRISAFPLF